MATLKDASITMTIPAPTYTAGITPAKPPELGKNTNAADDNNAPAKKYGFLLPNLFQVLSL